MNKVSNWQHESESDTAVEMLEEYDFSQGVRGKYVKQYRHNNLPTLPGIQFFTDERGRKTAVLVDLKQHQSLWKEIADKNRFDSNFQFLTDNLGEKIAVLLDFNQHLEVWQYMYDRLIAELLD